MARSSREEAKRRWSAELDGWDPPSFGATEEDFERAAAAIDPELKRHIAFSQAQVRGFAQALRGVPPSTSTPSRLPIVKSAERSTGATADRKPAPSSLR